MASIQVRKETNRLIVDFYYRGKRCREQTALEDTPPNRKKLEKILERIEADIKFGAFDYARSFPGSKNIAKFATSAPAKLTSIAVSVAQVVAGVAPGAVLPTFNTYPGLSLSTRQSTRAKG